MLVLILQLMAVVLHLFTILAVIMEEALSGMQPVVQATLTMLPYKTALL